PWPLARISAVNTIERATFDTYIHQRAASGQGITIYVLDTGVDGLKSNIRSRDFAGASFVGGNPKEDPHGHGTSIASVLVDPWIGVAPSASIVSVQVVKANGMTDESAIIKGLQWVHSRAKPGKSVVNLSLTSAKSKYLDSAILAMYRANIPVFTAAGNFYSNACHYSPASSPGAFTVAASDINDRLMDFSNWGECVDLIAPGYHAPTAWADGRWNLVSGTSVATAYVAGVAALFLSDPELNVTKV
ncbi:peptidase S8/S53 domain-containing protein, partial [Piptocephalis cylindrospora]